jgi:hypothetical protein
MGAVVAAADAEGAARDDGVIGALVCAHTGAASTSAAARAVPLKRCFMTIDPPGESHRVAGSWKKGCRLPPQHPFVAEGLYLHHPALKRRKKLSVPGAGSQTSLL